MLSLDMAQIDTPPDEPLPPATTLVALPAWADDIAVDGALLVPAQYEAAGTGASWERIDWLSAAFWYINGSAERAFEAAHGPIHSYSSRLGGWDARLWEHAWANRIGLLLRRMASRKSGRSEEEIFGPLPHAEIMLTHDVDAIRMSWSLRAKQCAFHTFNALHCLARGQLGRFGARLAAAARFAASSGDLWFFDELAALERSAGLASHFFVYGGDRRRKLRLKLIDPAYDISEPRLANTLKRLRDDGFGIGLHQSYDSWQDARGMRDEKARVEQALGAPVSACRQHWLRFSWADTWEAQDAAGLRLDATLGFNDRPGFRNGAALRFHPWNAARNAPLRLESVPMILMDSQLHDYADLDDDARERETRRWVDEVCRVGGTASVIWHQHVLGAEYGWRRGLEMLVRILGAQAA